MQAAVNPSIEERSDPAAPPPAGLAFDNTYARELEGFYVRSKPAGSPAPRLLQLNPELAHELGLDPQALSSPAGVSVLAGNVVPPGADPLAQAYAGHQFGGFSPQLGDGRALLLGELIDRSGQRRDIAFKGSGRTAFSRRGDGKAAVGPVLREYLLGEAMHVLGIATTRALAAVATGSTVQREQVLPGAILTRVAASHLRVGTFEFFAAREDEALLRRLADYAIARHDPQLVGMPDRYLGFLQAVVERQAALVARWMGIGFIHGVMNTDNMTISGETIDYGPCAFMEHFDPEAVFSSIDTGGRYAFGNQPKIAQWNLARFAETLLPLIAPDGDTARAVEAATEIVNGFAKRFDADWTQVLRAKLGLDGTDKADRVLADDYLALLQAHRIDFTLGFRRLNDAARGDSTALRTLFGKSAAALEPWLDRWQVRLGSVGQGAGTSTAGAERLAAMRRANPIYIPRNHQVEAALTAATADDDLAPFETLLSVLRQPFDERESDQVFSEPAPAQQTASYRTFCGT
ncbi:MAG TPA: YdiU family protein [Aquabacterium sp.]|nr:YdiU family protein [Piscinibacter sp.]HPM64632.1 YdiU family protein [Piscinibacter sp.]HQC94195.1 YdiU family protein [Aquabacterium sp.]